MTSSGSLTIKRGYWGDKRGKYFVRRCSGRWRTGVERWGRREDVPAARTFPSGPEMRDRVVDSAKAGRRSPNRSASPVSPRGPTGPLPSSIHLSGLVLEGGGRIWSFALKPSGGLGDGMFRELAEFQGSISNRGGLFSGGRLLLSAIGMGRGLAPAVLPKPSRALLA